MRIRCVERDGQLYIPIPTAYAEALQLTPTTEVNVTLVGRDSLLISSASDAAPITGALREAVDEDRPASDVW
jgi:antitoxin component of MazEF toxin-antitoxin module